MISLYLSTYPTIVTPLLHLLIFPHQRGFLRYIRQQLPCRLSHILRNNLQRTCQRFHPFTWCLCPLPCILSPLQHYCYLICRYTSQIAACFRRQIIHLISATFHLQHIAYPAVKQSALPSANSPLLTHPPYYFRQISLIYH